MSRVCCVCEKSTMSGNNVSHSKRRTRRSWNANVQKVKIVENGVAKSEYVCTRCLRSGKVERAQ